MTQQQLTQLLKLIKTTSITADMDELSTTVLQMAADSITLDRLKTLISSANTPPLYIGKGTSTQQENSQSIKGKNVQSYIITFTNNEVKRMEKTFKKHFILNGYIAHVIKRKSGKNGFYYEIRYRRNGYNIRAASVDINQAKRIFLEKTLPQNIGKYLVRRQKSGFNLLEEIFEEWHRYKKGTVNDKEHLRFQVNFNLLRPRHSDRSRPPQGRDGS